jgi:hypothetical protein
MARGLILSAGPSATHRRASRGVQLEARLALPHGRPPLEGIQGSAIADPKQHGDPTPATRSPSWLQRARAAAELSEETMEQIAQRVAQLLRHQLSGEMEPARLVDATTVARRYGLTRQWVYEHAHELGAIRLGNGGRPRLRFDLKRVAEALAQDSQHRPSAARRTVAQRYTRRGRPRAQAPPDVSLIPIKSRSAWAVPLRAARRNQLEGIC